MSCLCVDDGRPSHTEKVRHCRRSEGRNRGDVPDLSLPPFTDPSRNVSCEFCRHENILRPRNDETVAREDVDEPFLVLRILHRRAVKGMPKRKYATTRSMRATRLPNSSTYQTRQRKLGHVHITTRSVQQTLIDGEMGLQWAADVPRLVISITFHGPVYLCGFTRLGRVESTQANANDSSREMDQ